MLVFIFLCLLLLVVPRVATRVATQESVLVVIAATMVVVMAFSREPEVSISAATLAGVSLRLLR